MTTETTHKRMKTVFHADLSDAHEGEDYWLHAGGKRHHLIAHTHQSRTAAKAACSRLATMADSSLTHYTMEAVDLPADRVIRVHIKNSTRNQANAQSATGFGSVAIHIPPANAHTGIHATTATAHQQTIDYVSTAQALIFHHPDLINISPEVSALIFSHMSDNHDIKDKILNLAYKMKKMGQPTETKGWATLIPFTPPASNIKGCDGKTTYYKAQPAPEVLELASNAAIALMNVTKNDLNLQGKKWTVQQGTAVQNEVQQSHESLHLAACLKAGGTSTWKCALADTNKVHGVISSVELVDASKRQIKLTIKNSFIRYLAAYIRFYDAAGNVLSTPTWKPDDADIIYDVILNVMDVQYDDLRYLGYIQPVDNIMAIPIPGLEGSITVSITFPEAATSASIYCSGLGTGADLWPKTPIIGGILTGLLNLAIPTFMLGMGGAIQASKPLYDLVEEVMSNKLFVGMLRTVALVNYARQFGVSGVNNQMNWSAFASLADMLFNKAAEKFLLYCEATIAGEQAADEIPFAGWIILAVNILAGVAQMVETIVEVSTSPWNITNSISTAITTTVNIFPDPIHHAFPEAPAGQSTSLVVKMIYQSQTRPTVSVTIQVPANSTATKLTALFPNNTLGGKVKFEADFYIGTWLAGKATTGYMNNDEADVTDIEMTIVQYPIPLNSKSVYIHSKLLTYQNNAYSWQPTATAPTATVTAADTSSTGNAISIWSGLTLSQRHGIIGLAWKAAGTGVNSCNTGQGGQLFVMQNINIPGTDMNSVEFPGCGFDGQTLLTYDPYPPKFLMQDKQWVLGPDRKPVPDPDDKPLGEYYVDPRKASNNSFDGGDGGYHLRKITLAPATAFNMAKDQLSYGRFQHQPDSIALHPSGHVIAVNTQYSKIQIGELVIEGANDADVVMARVYSGQAQVPDRPGLMFNPVAVSCAYDGTILVLDDTKSSGGGVTLARIQAFDLNGNPCNRFFDSAGNPSPFLNLSSTGDNTYLDLVAIGDHKMTYMYVLYYTGNGANASDYHMSIYQYGETAPMSNPLVTTDGLAAARLSVDMWHTLYALNYEMVTDGNKNPAGPVTANTPVTGRTVPSVSEWLPPVPAN